METKPFIYFIFLLLFFKNFTYLFLERGEEKEKEKERNITVCLPLVCPLLGTWPSTQACALTGNGTSDPLVHRPELSPVSYTSQGPFMFFKHSLQSHSRYLVLNPIFLSVFYLSLKFK